MRYNQFLKGTSGMEISKIDLGVLEDLVVKNHVSTVEIKSVQILAKTT